MRKTDAMLYAEVYNAGFNGKLHDTFASLRVVEEKLKKDLCERIAASKQFPPQPHLITTYVNGQWIQTPAFRWSDRTTKSQIILRPETFMWNTLSDEIDAVVAKSLDDSIRTFESEKQAIGQFLKKIEPNNFNMNQLSIVPACPTKLTGSIQSVMRSPFKPNGLVTKTLTTTNEEPWYKKGFINWLIPEESIPFCLQKERRLFVKILHRSITELLQNKFVCGYDGSSSASLSVDDKQEDEDCTSSSDKEMLQDVKLNECMEAFLKSFNHNLRQLSFWIKRRMMKYCGEFLRNWQTETNFVDFQRFLCQQGTDYLVQIHHLFESKERNDRALREKRLKELRDTLCKLKQNHKRNKISRVRERLYEKLVVIDGQWNRRCITWNGLSGIPDLTDSQIKTHKFEEEEMKEIIAEAKSLGPENFNRDFDFDDGPDVIDLKSLQTRMDVLWKRLHISDQYRMNQTIHHCREADTHMIPLHSGVLSPQTVSLWETAADLIGRRESCMGKLAALEFAVMHPKHVKHPLSTLGAAKIREKLHKVEAALTAQIQTIGHDIFKTTHSLLLYADQPYLEKMKHDKTELLYWISSMKQNLK